MKKFNILSIVLIIAATLFLLTACGSNQNNVAQNENTQTTEPAVTETGEAEPAELDIEERMYRDTELEIVDYTDYNEILDSYFLSEGDKVAVITPSTMSTKEKTDAVVAGLQKWGFEPVLGEHVYPEFRTLEEGIEDLEWALTDPEIKAIFCVSGGYGATDVLDTISSDLIASANKPILGYGDIDAYHAGWTSAGLPSILASMSDTFIDLPEECAEAELNMLKGMIPSYKCKTNKYCREGSAEGVLIGGNLSTIIATVDTAYDYSKTGEPYILFIEDIGENVQHLHRYLTVLKHTGVLDNASGIIFGELLDCELDRPGNFGDQRGGFFESAEEMIDTQVLVDTDIPVAYGFPTGHGDLNYPLLMGANVKLEVSGDSYTVSW